MDEKKKEKRPQIIRGIPRKEIAGKTLFDIKRLDKARKDYYANMLRIG